MPLYRTRREALGLAGVGVTAALSGCSFGGSSSSPRYSLFSSPAGGTALADLFAWNPSGGPLHLRRNADALAGRLLDDGTLATEAGSIAPYDPNVDVPPAYVERDGAYYRVRVTDATSVSLDRWEFWFEPVPDVPSDAAVVTDPTADRSPLDAAIVERAVDAALEAVVGDEDLASARHGERGVVFHRPMESGDSDLVPDPPFEYVRVDPDTEFLDDQQTLRARAERGTVETRRYTHEAERVADSEAELEAVLADHVDAGFDGADEGVRDIVAEASDGGTYAEREPISESFDRLLDELGVTDPSPPDDSGVRTWLRHYRYDGSYYRTTIRIRNE